MRPEDGHPGPEWHRRFFDDLYCRLYMLRGDDECDAIASILARAMNLPEGSGSGFDQGCGAGGIARAMERRGALVQAFDCSPDMIARARAAGTRDAAIQDARTAIAAPDGGFSFGYNWGSGLGYSGLSDTLTMLRCAADALAPGAPFLVETMNLPHLRDSFLPTFQAARTDADTGEAWTVTRDSAFDGVPVHPYEVPVLVQDWTFEGPDGKRVQRRTAVDAIGPAALRALAEMAGFEDVRSLDPATLGPSTRHSPRILATMRRRRDREVPSVLGERLRGALAARGGDDSIRDGEMSLSGTRALEWAMRLAIALRGAGPRPGSCAAIMTGRTWATPLAIAACRIAGSPFAIIDPAMAPARLESAMRRLRPGATIAFARDEVAAALAARFRERSPGDAYEVREPAPGAGSVTVESHRHARALPEGTSHVCLTSGSSGEPKAVLCREDGLLATADAQAALIGERDGEGLWTLNPSFDASLSDILTALLARRPLRAHRPPMTRLKSLRAALRGAATADLPPSLMGVVDPAEAGLKVLVFGGERARPDDVRKWGRHCLALQAYGPTEASVCAAMAVACDDWAEGEIGRPLVPGSIAVLTAKGPVAVEAAHPAATPADGAAFNRVTAPGLEEGETGEILIFGPQVALGYLGDEARTALRFPEVGGARCHATGDIARHEGGRLIWTGRNDRQMKVNGRLICPEEIEAAAAAATGGAAHCWPDAGGIALATESGDPKAIADSVERALGPAFRPGKVVVTGAFARTPNGKVDARAVEAAAARTKEMPN